MWNVLAGYSTDAKPCRVWAWGRPQLSRTDMAGPPLNYFEQFIDKDLMKMISDCSNAMSLARSGVPLNTSVDELYHFFGACILMSCVRYPKIRMYWSKTLRFTAITDKFTRDRFFRLRRSLKVLVEWQILEGEAFSGSDSARLQVSDSTWMCIDRRADDTFYRSMSM